LIYTPYTLSATYLWKHDIYVPLVSVYIMVKNGPNSLRNTTSNLSLRGSASTQSLRASAHEYAARQRIAELEAQVAALEARESAKQPQPCRAVPKTKGPFTFSDYNLPEPAERFAGEWTPQEEAEKVDVLWQKQIENAMWHSRPDDLSQGMMETVKQSVRREMENEVEQRGFKKGDPLERLGLEAAFTFTSGLEEKYIEDAAEEGRKKKMEDWSLFEKFNETFLEQSQKPKGSLITKGLVREGNALKSPEAYTQPFCDFLTENPTVWHAVDYFETKLKKAGFKKVGLIM
jgi:aminopeptidase I